MKGIRYTAEFKAKAIKQITERGHKTADVADRLSSSFNLKESIRYKKLAEEAGFEPATELPLCHLSRVVPSTAQPLIRILILDLHTWKPRHYIAPSLIIPMQIARV
jgi:transposase-like protein